MRKKKKAETVELLVDIRKTRAGWLAKCRMIGCTWKDWGPDEPGVAKKWIRHFQSVHIAKFDGKT